MANPKFSLSGPTVTTSYKDNSGQVTKVSEKRTDNAGKSQTTIFAQPESKITVDKTQSYEAQVNEYLSKQAGTYGQVSVPTSQLVSALNKSQSNRYGVNEVGDRVELSTAQKAGFALQPYFESGKGNYGTTTQPQRYYNSLGIQAPYIETVSGRTSAQQNQDKVYYAPNVTPQPNSLTSPFKQQVVQQTQQVPQETNMSLASGGVGFVNREGQVVRTGVTPLQSMAREFDKPEQRVLTEAPKQTGFSGLVQSGTKFSKTKELEAQRAQARGDTLGYLGSGAQAIGVGLLTAPALFISSLVHPIQTAKGVVEAVKNPYETGAAIYQEIQQNPMTFTSQLGGQLALGFGVGKVIESLTPIKTTTTIKETYVTPLTKTVGKESYLVKDTMGSLQNVEVQQNLKNILPQNQFNKLNELFIKSGKDTNLIISKEQKVVTDLKTGVSKEVGKPKFVVISEKGTSQGLQLPENYNIFGRTSTSELIPKGSSATEFGTIKSTGKPIAIIENGKVKTTGLPKTEFKRQSEYIGYGGEKQGVAVRQQITSVKAGTNKPIAQVFNVGRLNFQPTQIDQTFKGIMASVSSPNKITRKTNIDIFSVPSPTIVGSKATRASGGAFGGYFVEATIPTDILSTKNFAQIAANKGSDILIGPNVITSRTTRASAVSREVPLITEQINFKSKTPNTNTNIMKNIEKSLGSPSDIGLGGKTILQQKETGQIAKLQSQVSETPSMFSPKNIKKTFFEVETKTKTSVKATPRDLTKFTPLTILGNINKTIEPTKFKTTLETGKLQGVGQGQNLFIGQSYKPLTLVGTRTGLGSSTIQQTIQKVTTQNIPTNIPTGIFTVPKFPFGNFPGMREQASRRNVGKSFGREFGYQSSLKANILKIKVPRFASIKRKSMYSGQELRPL